MKVPPLYLSLAKQFELPEEFRSTTPDHYEVGADGTWIGRLPDGLLVYPPVGFLAWPFCEIGNGDGYGFYWPLGMENESPVVAIISHDYSALNPVASSMEALAREGRCSQLTELLGMDPVDETLDIAERLKRNERSPFLLVANADAALGRNELDLAENLYLKAVKEVPEYTAAHYGLVVLYRRLRRPMDAVHWMLETIRSPVCFRGASFWADEYLPDDHVNRCDFHRKCLYWLRQTRSAEGVDGEDPLFIARERLTFAAGVTTNDDYLIYDEAIDAYVRQGRPLEAVKLAMRSSELMRCETTPFQERYGFTMERQRAQRVQVFKAAGLESRVRLVE